MGTSPRTGQDGKSYPVTREYTSALLDLGAEVVVIKRSASAGTARAGRVVNVGAAIASRASPPLAWGLAGARPRPRRH